ncbi:CDGSH iron-sulfur domain-containing protein 1 [Conger conger]|uniref:CDGSH iron-sulfur domain-containing protein 1 n=1 Tax=Conger conger TaxID=82655 RepID=UPI002A5AB005|nr:CDGSH iron-sulfur domain-containing protein 1 [Conger conger]
MSARPLPMFALLRWPVISAGFRIPKGRLTTVFPLGATVAFRTILSGKNTEEKDDRINKTIDKDVSKVVHNFNVEDLGSKVAFCRCWKSKKFPYCDGSHGLHNRMTGDNVGPLIIIKKA